MEKFFNQFDNKTEKGDQNGKEKNKSRMKRIISQLTIKEKETQKD